MFNQNEVIMKKIKYLFVSTLVLLWLNGPSPAQTIHIPEDKLSIQEGIDIAEDGDTVLVFPGEYFENINLKGKNIVLASTFVTTGDLDLINQTIINGSTPVYSDTASCILIISGESRNCVIAGFTLTGGKGTKWEDEHNRGYWYTEGGGILIQNSSPTIRNNVIHDNEAINKAGAIVSAGGGAIRMGDSNPAILNNYIHHNKGKYGAGIVLNYSGAIIRNNLITNNSGGQDYGGAGLWILGNSDDPRLLENNTIVNNTSFNVGGGVRIWTSTVVLTNNIIRGNHASQGLQIHGSGTITYCNVEGGKAGEGNIDNPPRFDNVLFTLPDGAASIDGGNPHASFNDTEDPSTAGSPLFPSKGTLRNDIGVYGGPGAQAFPSPDLSDIADIDLNKESLFRIYPNPAKYNIMLEFNNNIKGSALMEIINLNGQCVFSKEFEELSNSKGINFHGTDLTAGLYMVKITTQQLVQTQQLVVN